MVTDMIYPARQGMDFSIPANSLKEGKINLIGFPFDGTACFKKGARLAPDTIREHLQHIESYSPYLNKDLLEIEPIADVGNIAFLKEPIDYTNKELIDLTWLNSQSTFAKLTENFNLKSPKTRMLCLGGEHSISINPISLYLKNYDNLVLLHLDAHADLRDSWNDFAYSHASIIKNCINLFGKNHQLIQYGIRSGTKEEFEWMKKNNTRILHIDALIEKIISLPQHTPVYMTLDLDFLDPGIFPGTGTPEAGGESFHNLIRIFKALNNKNLLAADIVELSPNIDETGISNIVATTVFRELLLLLS
jgi:agmatinase